MRPQTEETHPTREWLASIEKRGLNYAWCARCGSSYGLMGLGANGPVWRWLLSHRYVTDSGRTQCTHDPVTNGN